MFWHEHCMEVLLVFWPKTQDKTHNLYIHSVSWLESFVHSCLHPFLTVKSCDRRRKSLLICRFLFFQSSDCFFLSWLVSSRWPSSFTTASSQWWRAINTRKTTWASAEFIQKTVYWRSSCSQTRKTCCGKCGRRFTMLSLLFPGALLSYSSAQIRINFRFNDEWQLADLQCLN